MNKQIITALVLFYFVFTGMSVAQTTTDTIDRPKMAKLFRSQRILPVRMSYSNKAMKKETNDSTYITTNLEYQTSKGNWKTMEVELRGRGNFRLKNCYFSPIKFKIKKVAAKGTIFKGHKRLKMVLPCFVQTGNNNKVVKEYMAYKFYELLSPYHFKTRLLDIDFNEVKGANIKNHKLKGFLIEDDKVVAKRYKGRAMDRKVHHMAQDTLASVRNAFFQYMIGNTDFSVLAGHNEQLMFINKIVLPIPFDFDMSGFVNASYSIVSSVGKDKLPIKNVRQRLYRGYTRSDAVFQKIRQEYLVNKDDIFKIIEDCKSLFDDVNEFEKAKTYIDAFYEILIHDEKFAREIVEAARNE